MDSIWRSRPCRFNKRRPSLQWSTISSQDSASLLVSVLVKGKAVCVCYFFFWLLEDGLSLVRLLDFLGKAGKDLKKKKKRLVATKAGGGEGRRKGRPTCQG